jgi:hypothetical protein
MKRTKNLYDPKNENEEERFSKGELSESMIQKKHESFIELFQLQSKI